MSTDIDEMMTFGKDLLLHGIELWIQYDRDRCMGDSRPNVKDFGFTARR